MKRIIVFVFYLSIILNVCTADPADSSRELWLSGHFAQAENEYNKNLKNNNSLQTKIELISFYKSQGKYKKAIDIAESIPKGQKTMSIYTSLGECYYYISNPKRAKIFIKKALAKDPSSFVANFTMARILYDLNELTNAKKYFHKLIKLDSSFSASYYYLGKIYDREHKTQRAIANYRKALKYDIYFVEAREKLGKDYLKANAIDKAYKEFYRIKNADPGNRLANKTLKHIKPLLKKPEKEIIKTKKQKSFKEFQPIKKIKKIPNIRVGINTNSKGKPNGITSLMFRARYNFYFKSRKNKKILKGNPSTIYKITQKGGDIIITDNNDLFLAQTDGLLRIVSKKKNYNSFILDAIQYAKGSPWQGKADRQYRGSLEFVPNAKGIKIINIVNLEEYILSVLPSEMMSWWPKEALKAQAVLARSYLLYKIYHLPAHKHEGYDICDSQHCQVYRGINSETKNTNLATLSTRGEILMHEDKIVHAFYHSNSGGQTQSSGEVYGWGDLPYLKNTFNGYASTQKPQTPSEIENWIKTKPITYSNVPSLKYPVSFRWIRIIPARFIEEKINRKKKIGKLKKIKILKRSSSGNVTKVKIIGTKDNLILQKENEIRKYIGLGSLRSTLFWLETKYKNNKPQEFTIYGGGWGHGIGMCQTGAAGMALQDFTYDEILSHYYKNTHLAKIN